MTTDLAIFVSKRLQRAAAALVCLMALQLLAAVLTHAAPSGAPVVHVRIES